MGGKVSRFIEEVIMKVLLAIEPGEAGERVAGVIGPWARGAQAEVHLLTVLSPKRIHGTDAGDTARHELTPASTVTGALLHSEQPAPRSAETRQQAYARKRDETSDRLSDLGEKYLSGVIQGRHVEIDDEVARSVLRVADRLGIELIAMGTHSRTGLSHALMGSVAESVIRHSHVPVVVVGPQTPIPPEV